MKSEHRHELAQNDLSKVLSKWGAEFDKHADKILTVLIVVLLVAAGIIWWTRSSSANSALGWTDLARANSAEAFQGVAEDYAGTPVAQWATLRAADGFLDEGIRLSLTDRPASTERLTQARESYEALLNNTAAPREIREQALVGYAVTLESLSDGDTSEAVAAYEQLLSEFDKTRFRRFATERIDELKTGGAQDFYAWFHRLNPKPADMPLPQDQSQELPNANDLSNLLPELGGSGVPETAPFNIPAAPGDGTSAEDVNPFADAEMKKPGEGDAKPADGAPPTEESAPEKPAAEKPEAEKPDTPAADKPKPDTEKPAAEAKPDAPQAESDKPAKSPEKADDAPPETESEPQAENSADSKPETPATEDQPADTP